MLAFGSQPFRDHLKENSFWRDPSSGAVRSPDTALRRAISNNTLATVVGDLGVAWVVAKSADVLAQKLSQVDASVDTLRADWTYGLELLLSQAEAQNRRLTDIVAKLDEIHKTLESPLLTQARELYRIGSERLSKGLLDKALEAFLQAEQKNDADFFIEYQIGKLYLYGIDHDDNIVDIEQAKLHLKQAVRYGEAELQAAPEFARLVGEAGLHLSIAFWACASDRAVSGQPTESRASLEEARKAVRRAIEANPRLSESHYHSAKYSALLGETESALPSLEAAIKLDRGYCLKVCSDPDFDGMSSEVAALIERLRGSAADQAARQLDELQQDIASHVYLDDEAKKDKDALVDLTAKAEASIRLHTYYGHLDAVTTLTSAKEKFPSPRLHAEQVAEFEHPEEVTSIALSPDGQTLATACFDGGIRLWDALEQRPPNSVDTAGYAGMTNAVTFSPDGSLLAWTRADFTVCVKRLRSKPEATVLKDSAGLTFPLVFDPTGRLLVTGRDEHTSAVVWDVQELREVATLSGAGGSKKRLCSLAFSPDGRYIASGDVAGVVSLWHSKDGRMVKSVSGQNDNAIPDVAFSSDGSLLVGVGGACVAVWRVPDLTLVTRDELSIPSPLSCVSFAARDAILLFGNAEGGVGFTSWERGLSFVSFERESQRPAHDDRVSSIALSRGESMMATGSDDGWARLWKLHARGAFPRELLRRMDEEQSELTATLRLRREKEKRCVLCGRELGFWEKRRKQITCGACVIPGAPRSR